MIILEDRNPEELYKKAFLEVYKLPDLEGDPKNYKDTSAVLTLRDYKQDDGVVWDERGFRSNFDYTQYIKEGSEQIKLEVEHYYEEFIESGKLESFFKYFKSDVTTKKGLINLWANDHLDSEKPFPCLTYVWFRKSGNILHMNCHMRANDAYKVLIMDLHVGTSLHSYVATKLGLKKGIYHHFIDTLHLYHRNKPEIEALHKKLTSV